VVRLVELAVFIDDQRCVGETANDDHQNEQEGSYVFKRLFDYQNVEGGLFE